MLPSNTSKYLNHPFFEDTNNSLPDYTENVKSVSNITIDQYNKTVTKYASISSDKLIDYEFNKPTLIFFGNDSCLFCREFSILLDASLQFSSKKYCKNFSIYYYDTSLITSDKNLKNISTQYSLKYLPTLIYVKSDKSYLTFDEEKFFLSDWLNFISE